MHLKPDADADADAGGELSSPRSRHFRQRNMHAADPEAATRKVAAFDVENPSACAGGLRPSESVAKLESLERAAVAPAVVLKTAFYILVWYTFSTCLTLYNKTLLGEKLGKFPAPLLMNTVHFAMQAALSKIILCFHSRGPENVTGMSWKDYFIRVVPTALGTALDINLSNASLVFISVTFATMCKSASPIFLLLFAFAFRLESPSIKLLGIIVVISVGVLLTVAKETEFEFWGFIFVMLAAVMSGFRWSMTQILLQKETYGPGVGATLFGLVPLAPVKELELELTKQGLKNPITLMSHVTPMMAIATLALSLLMDPWRDFQKNAYFDNPWHVMRSCLLMLIGGTLAFFMVLTEYILVSETSAITVTIAGVVKEAVTILVAVFYFNENFTLLKGIGLVTIMVGVSLFNWYKYERFKKGQTDEEDIDPPSNGVAKYVILDDMESQDEDT